MKKFNYLFGVVLGERIYKHTDNLSETLQYPALRAVDGQHLADLTCMTLLCLYTPAPIQHLKLHCD